MTFSKLFHNLPTYLPTYLPHLYLYLYLHEGTSAQLVYHLSILS
jgi:hypothetical protein